MIIQCKIAIYFNAETQIVASQAERSECRECAEGVGGLELENEVGGGAECVFGI